MKQILYSLFISLFTSSVYSFTNGTLLPAYLCGLPDDGYPKSVGGIIPYFKLGFIDTHYNVFPPGPGFPIAINDGINSPTNNALAPNAQQIIGSFHNGQPQNNYINAIQNIITIVPTDYIDSVTGNIKIDFKIYPKTCYNMTLIVNYPTFNTTDIALDGAFVYALDTFTNERVGHFNFFGDNMQPWYACSLNNKFHPNTGIVHNTLLTENTYYNVKWTSPNVIQGNISFIGAGVTDAGFGPFKTTFNTVQFRRRHLQ